MKQNLWIPLVLLLNACEKPTPPALVEEKVEIASSTNWTQKTELFVEYPPLAAGQISRFAIHLTRLDNFKAMRQGVVEVRLGQSVFEVAAPSRPGIFGVDVKPQNTGDFPLSIHLKGEGLDDFHQLGTVKVTAKRERSKAEEATNEISFLKEQQWTLDFGTSLVVTKTLQEDLRVPAEVTARSGGEADVDAPLDGRLTLDPVPVIGTAVKAGQELARLTLLTSTPNDLTGLELARTEAQTILDLSRKDRLRASRLLASGAAPARRLEEATALEQNAEARLKAAEARLAQYDNSSNAEGRVSGSKLFVLRAPISGTIQTVKTTPGANVKAGQMLFQIVDLDQVFVSAILPESEFPKMRSLTGAELEIPGVEQPRRLNRLIAIGRVVDSPSRTFPVTYAIDNRDRRVAINQTVYVRLFSGTSESTLVVPDTAIVDDQGQSVIYLQTGGESFFRQPVKLGKRQSGLVQIIEGLKPGDRVVSIGAHLLRLASMSSSVPAHGHVH